MKKIIFFLGAVVLSGCSRPHGPAEKILNQELILPNNIEQQTKITVTRNKQFIGGGSGGMCKFLVSIDDRDIALLRQNQFVTAYINNGSHKLRVSNECNVLSMGMRKTLDVIADGSEQEYVTEIGMWGQYRMWRTK
ncbi:hypothetical protein BJK05_04390 [Pectobacterium polaris]|uniref:Membrane lipoprotein lipid attachment site-containing protein n=1 Tax=Pectobacterium polaris TaxID=2042057 RepID=A0AAW4P5Q4_9GAMM|nr:lipoprotein [Pectobacterium polaris]ASY79274.1 hypothetical protein BJK05_04390 [Pectobacterium polaris]MBW5894537.1 membrane lipoprotein lipid attachment site-containing protein [Pectobacterium polaris]MCA6941275.1 membrane lipoprotein lipid attachment site-containing protein [Pectobacterium polaris]MCA6958879.1 membrane lipoprotein lipid attachment site-containing protein [Pectobacterium polaris]MCL6359553.1 hypothetical protein [Pectobacterium polaris]